jgi:hypothetical protein
MTYFVTNSKYLRTTSKERRTSVQNVIYSNKDWLKLRGLNTRPATRHSKPAVKVDYYG